MIPPSVTSGVVPDRGTAYAAEIGPGTVTTCPEPAFTGSIRAHCPAGRSCPACCLLPCLRSTSPSRYRPGRRCRRQRRCRPCAGGVAADGAAGHREGASVGDGDSSDLTMTSIDGGVGAEGLLVTEAAPKFSRPVLVASPPLGPTSLPPTALLLIVSVPTLSTPPLIPSASARVHRSVATGFAARKCRCTLIFDSAAHHGAVRAGAAHRDVVDHLAAVQRQGAEVQVRVPRFKMPPPQLLAKGQSAPEPALPPLIVMLLRGRFPPLATLRMRRSGAPDARTTVPSQDVSRHLRS